MSRRARGRDRARWCDALRASGVLGPFVKDGKRALRGDDRSKVVIDAACSIALDEDGPAGDPDEKRWDYMLVARAIGHGHAVEIHTATPGDVKHMIAKKAWAERLLAKECPRHTVSKWHWVARTHVDFPRHRTRERELLLKAGIEPPCAHLTL
jgi:hypothetical protein